MNTPNRSKQSLRSKRLCWNQSAGNLLKMGHCAPTVMQTILDSSGTQKERLVKLSAGMPGGGCQSGS
jgi:hypothetical protein